MKRLIHLILLMAPTLALADDDDHDRAREALRRGEVLPLATILARVEAELEGRVIAVEFEREGGRFVYELEVATEDGRLREVYVDAATGELLGSEQDEDD